MIPPNAAGFADLGRRNQVKSGRPAGRTLGRAELARHPQFADVSPEVGVLDEAALDRALAEDPSSALALLADMTTATDEGLRASVRRVAARLVLDRSRVGRPRTSGLGRPRLVPASLGGDLDIDSSMEAIAAARSEGRPPSLDDLDARDWGRPDLALVVLVDHSGSMNGERLAAAAVTAAACALRAPGQHAVLAFARDVQVIKALHGEASPSSTVERVLRLRGHGVTGLAKALNAANDELSEARATRQIVILLSDCRATDEQDPIPAAHRTSELIILAPADDSEQAAALAAASGAKYAAMHDVASVPALLEQLLS